MCELGFFVNNRDTTYNPHLDICNEAKDRGLSVADLLTHKYPLAQINDAMEKNISMDGLKIVVLGE